MPFFVITLLYFVLGYSMVSEACADNDPLITSNVGYLSLNELDLGLSYDEESQTLTWLGQINHLEMEKFTLLGWDEKPIKRLVIRSGGGSTAVSWAFSDFVRKNNITVEVAKQCDSACTLIALNSLNLVGHGTLGFHLPYLTSARGMDTSSVSYKIALATIEKDISDVIQFFEKNQYMNETLLHKIKTESNKETLIEVDVRSIIYHNYIH